MSSDSHTVLPPDDAFSTFSSEPYDSSFFRQRRFDYCPWTFRDADPEELAAQRHYQQALARETGATLGEDCYVSPRAAIVEGVQGSLTLGNRCFVAAQAYITGRVSLGDDCTINPHVTVRENVHGGHSVRIGAYACLVGHNHR